MARRTNVDEMLHAHLDNHTTMLYLQYGNEKGVVLSGMHTSTSYVVGSVILKNIRTPP